MRTIHRRPARWALLVLWLAVLAPAAEVAAQAGEGLTPVQIARLRKMINGQKEAAEEGHYSRFNELDEAFHRGIADIVQSNYAWRVVEAARFQTDRVRLLSVPDASPLGLLIEQHEAIVDRLEAGDGDGAADAMRRHLREILRALSRIAAEHPDFFSDVELPEHTAGVVPVDA
jgi:DNA-binding GntR family transcriptional regulator